jgi:hypothetical protein
MSVNIATMGMFDCEVHGYDGGSSGIGYGGEMMEVPYAKKKKHLKVSVNQVNILEYNTKIEVTPIEVEL